MEEVLSFHHTDLILPSILKETPIILEKTLMGIILLPPIFNRCVRKWGMDLVISGFILCPLLDGTGWSPDQLTFLPALLIFLVNRRACSPDLSLIPITFASTTSALAPIPFASTTSALALWWWRLWWWRLWWWRLWWWRLWWWRLWWWRLWWWRLWWWRLWRWRLWWWRLWWWRLWWWRLWWRRLG